MQKAEVLAPAGDINCLKAAVNAGCDAIYIGGSMFSARYKAGIDYEDMAYGIRYAHLHNRKIYLTVNTLLKNSEIEKELYDFIKTYYYLGIDAVIVQDAGVLNFLNYHFNDLELHASTQMTINTHYAYDYLKKYNVTRIVTPRELSLNEIKRIKHETNLSIETFVHGALCYGYSGQCMLSSLNGKRSGNRGRCAQICRKCYTYNNKKSYILSLKDLIGLSNIGELIENGVDSLKIEGRMKKPEYVALVSNIYRQYVDHYYEYGINKKVSEEDIIKLSDIYNRGGFTKGFYHVHNDSSMLSDKRPNHYGTLVGKVISIKGNSCTIEFSKKVNSHDVLMIRSDTINDSDDNTYEFTLKNAINKGDKLNAPFIKGKKLKIGQQVFRMRNEELINDITEKFIKNDKKVPVNAKFALKKGKPTVFSINDTITVYGDIAEEAKNSSVTTEQVKKQLSKLGDTLFVYNKLSIDIDDNVFIPMGSLNKLRREAFSKYQEYLSENDKRNTDNVKPLKSIKKSSRSVKQEIAVSVAESEQLEAVLKFEFYKYIFIDMTLIDSDNLSLMINKVSENTNKKIYIILPHLIRYKDIDTIINEYNKVFEKSSYEGFVVRNFEGFYIAQKYRKSVITDYNMYVLNNYAKEAYGGFGAKYMSASLELSKKELEEIDGENMILKIYGKVPAFVSANCINKNINKCDKQKKNIIIKGELNDIYDSRNICKFCYNILYKSDTINLFELYNDIKNMNFGILRIDFTTEKKDEALSVLEDFSKNTCKKGGFFGHFVNKTE